jgi:hypothetical protein
MPELKPVLQLRPQTTLQLPILPSLQKPVLDEDSTLGKKKKKVKIGKKSNITPDSTGGSSKHF